MYIDFKISTWERYYIPEEGEQAVREALKQGKITSANDLWGLDKDPKDPDYWEPYPEGQIGDTDEQLDPMDNNGYSTIEAYDDNMNLIYQNVKGL